MASTRSTGPPSEERLLRLLLEQGNEHAVILMDARGIIRAWLMGARRIFGFEAHEMLGTSTEKLFAPEDQARRIPADELDKAALHGIAEDDRWMLRRDGVRFWASGVVYALREASGEPAGFAKVLRDRTDQRGQVEALKNRADALGAAESRKMVTLGTLAHELRNPLGVLANGLQLIEMADSADAKVGYASQLIGRQLKYMTKLIEDLLDLVRARVGKAALEIERVELAEVVDAALETAAATIADKRQRVQVLIEPGPIVLEADSARLRQIVVNLVTNASRYSEPEATIWLKGMIEGNDVVLRVEDEGAGIAPDVLPRIFDAFAQAAAPTHDRSTGLGLGLAIVKEYVELHGGTVQVRSEGVGRGAEFIVRLPFKPPE